MRPSGAAYGWGATAGLTVKLWNLELDVNYTLRQRPSRSLSEVVIPESILFMSASMDGILKK